MEGMPASFNPWTLLDQNDPGDVIGKPKPKDKDAATAKKKPAAAPAWVSNKAMHSSTPAKKNKKKKTAASGNPANGKAVGPAGKQSGAAKANKNGVYGGGKNQGGAGQRGYYNNGGYNEALDEAEVPVVKEPAPEQEPILPPRFDDARAFPALGPGHH